MKSNWNFQFTHKSSTALLLSAILSSAPQALAAPNCPIVHTEKTSSLTSSKSPEQSVQDFRTLRLKSPDGKVTTLPANNFYQDTVFQELARKVLSRPASKQKAINEELTRMHGRNGNTFQKKDHNGEYKIEFTPEINGAVIPIPKDWYEGHTESMAATTRALRALSQKIFTSGDLMTKYTDSSLSEPQRKDVFQKLVRHLQIEDFPALEQRQVVDIVANNIYFIPELVHPNMKEYPFLGIIGYDAAVETLLKVTAVFYEYNSGTPSGLSNNIQILELLRKLDPELYATFKDYLEKDRTFENLKKVVDHSARKWTKAKDGISVIIGPGSFNGANPDVAAISAFSGMPIVRPQDLYYGKDGWLYLNAGQGNQNPKVTGIYSRIEESAFFNSAKDGIGWISPELKENEELGRKWGVPLKNGVNYQWVFDAQGNKVGVEKDEAGQAKIAQYGLGMVGQDPTRPGSAPEHGFHWGVINKKFWFSGTGGRVVDDKRLFAIMSDLRANKYFTPGYRGPFARPPRTLKEQELPEFYAAPEKFVVKVPDESGGVGVYLGPLLSKEELKQVVERVRADRASGLPTLTIQDFTTAAVLVTPVEQNGKIVYATSVPDIRSFLMMDADGKAYAGNNAFLIRLAKHLSPSTNTSQGAGYAIGAVMDFNNPQPRDPNESLLPNPKRSLPLAASYRADLENFVTLFKSVLEISQSKDADRKLKEKAPHNPYWDPTGTWTRIDVLLQFHKEVMPIIGIEHNYLQSILKEYQAGKINSKKLAQQLAVYHKTLLEQPAFATVGVQDILRK